MFDPHYSIAQCNVCRKEYTSFHLEAAPGLRVYVCQYCLGSLEENFVWICMNCGRSYRRPKNLVMNRTSGYGLDFARQLYESRLLQGLEHCIECDPEGVFEYVHRRKAGKEAGEEKKHVSLCRRFRVVA